MSAGEGVSIYKLSIADIDLDSAMVRHKVDNGTVDDYFRALKAGEELPEGHVFEDPETNEVFLADGRHRIEARINFNETEIAMHVHKGTLDDAIWFATQAAKRHGLRMTKSDKRKAVNRAWDCSRGKGLSARKIAEHCGVSHTFARAIQKERQEKEERAKRKPSDSEPSAENVTADDVEQEEEPEVLVDKYDVEIPEHALGVFALIPEWEAVYKEIGACISKINALASGESGQHFDKTSCIASLRNARNSINQRMPHAVCPYCLGRRSNCKACHGLGYVDKLVYKQAPKD